MHTVSPKGYIILPKKGVHYKSNMHAAACTSALEKHTPLMVAGSPCVCLEVYTSFFMQTTNQEMMLWWLYNFSGKDSPCDIFSKSHQHLCTSYSDIYTVHRKLLFNLTNNDNLWRPIFRINTTIIKCAFQFSQRMSTMLCFLPIIFM